MKLEIFQKQNHKTGNHQSVRRTWILLFGIFILIALLLMSLYFSNVNRIISENLQDYNRAKLGQTKGSLDFSVAKLLSTADSIAADSSITEVGMNDSFEKNRQVIRNINGYLEDKPFIYGVMLLSQENGMVIMDRGAVGEKVFYTANFSETFSREAWLSLFYDTDFQGYVELPMIEDGRLTVNRLAYIRPSEQHNVNIMVVLNHRNVLEADPYFYRVVMVNSHGNAFAVTGPENDPFVIDYDKLTEKEGTYEYSSDNYISYISSDIADLKYVLFTDKEIFMKNLGETRWLTVFYLVLYFIIGILLALWFSKKQYMPIKSIAELVKFPGTDSGKNEYDVVKNGITLMLKENAGISKEMEKKDSYLREHTVINILKGKQTNPEFQDGIGLDGKQIALIKILWNSKQSDALNYSDIISYALKNISEEIFSELGDVYSAEVDDSVVNLIVLGDTNDAAKKLSSCSKRLLEVLKKYLNMDLEIVLGRIAVTKEEIPELYEEMMEASQLFGLQEEKIIFAAEIAERNHGDYSYSLKTELEIISLMKNGDADGAIDLITGTVKEMVYQKKLSIYMLRCFMIDLEGTILKVLDEVEHKNDVKMAVELLNLNELFRCNSIAEMQRLVCEDLRSVCDFVLQNNSQYGSELCEEIRQYIRANFHNAALNVNQVAKDIHLNATYISSTFKKNTGMRLLEYINLIRIEEAKKLMLQQPDLSIEMVAEMTGFANTRTFRRVFGKYEAVSPRKYAKQ